MKIPNSYKRLYNYLFLIKLIAILIIAFAPHVLPHVTRQVDTMAITLRYWMRWTMEANPQYPLLPAYLGQGDFYSLQFMEFPILNVLMAPLFAFGIEAGRVLNNIVFVLINLGLVYLGYRKFKGKTISGILMDDAFLMLFLISGSGFFFYKLIPDFTALALILLAVAFSWEEDKKNWWASFFLLALGALIKPPQVVALGLFLLHTNRKYVLKCATWIIPAAIPCGLYYTWGSKTILSMLDAPNRFGTHIRNPIESFIAFFSNPKEVFNVVNETYFGKFVLIPILIYLGILIYQKKVKRVSPLVIVLILQSIGLILLDGDHLYIHRYYFCGLSLTASMIFVKFSSESGKVLNIIALLLIAGSSFERWSYEIRPLFKENTYRQCSELKKRNPTLPWGQNYSFRTEIRRDPFLGLCFGEREGSQKSEYGFYFKDQKVPEDCQLLDKKKDISLVKCQMRVI